MAVGDEEIAKIEKRISHLETEKEKRIEKIAELGEKIDGYDDQIHTIGQKLLEAQEAAQYEREREEKRQQKTVVENQLKEVSGDILRWISTKALPSVSERLIHQSLDFIDEESLKGKIPSPYNEGFVKGLLSAKRCICDRTLEPGTEEWRAVTSLLSNAANAEVLSRVVRARARIEVLKEQRADAPGLLKSQEEKQARLSQQFQDLERRIAEIGMKLESLPVAEIRERERARRELTEARKLAEIDQIKAARDNEHADEEIRRLNRTVGEARASEHSCSEADYAP